MNPNTMMVGCPPGGIGAAPSPYPVVVNQPLDRAYLRPLQEPLSDAECILLSSVPTSLTFFQRPVSQTTASCGVIKDFSETGLTQSSMLDYPREFSILGFNVALDATIGIDFQQKLYRRAFFEFVYSGRRPYLRIPFNRMPTGQGPTGALTSPAISATSLAIATAGIGGTYSSSNVATGANAGLVGFATNGLPHAGNYHKFNLGRSALKIKPGEAFNTKITWPSVTGETPITLNNLVGITPGATDVGMTAAGFFCHTFIIGLSWQSL